ncbi:MAG: T9SS type A sorting domain-containing protein [Ignavibacteria bacterium]|nr:T9SS type A sorting domain-containing protein [Ignavibacteria bacterium]
MKNFLVLSLFLFSVSMFGQATIDFETVGQDYKWNIFANGSGDSTALSVVANPNTTGINTSAKCLKYVVAPNADPWSGFYGQSHGSFTLNADNSMITMMVYKDVISPVDLKLEPPNVDHKVPNTVINQWEKLTFDYTSAIGTTVATITLIPDFPDPRTGGSVNYMDNIEFIHTPVPVELTSFSATTVKNSVQLEWATATETNNKGFEIQKSSNRVAYVTIAFVDGNGTSTSSHEYSFVDTKVSGKSFYRLCQVDFDGTSKYSKVVEVGELAPASFELSQNFPNPFNPVTNIKYSVASAQQVTLKIFNVLGKEVATLINERKEAGNYNVDFSAANLSSGTYIYRLQAGAFVQTKKMVVLK